MVEMMVSYMCNNVLHYIKYRIDEKLEYRGNYILYYYELEKKESFL